MTSLLEFLLVTWNTIWVSTLFTLKTLFFSFVDHPFWIFLDNLYQPYATDYTLFFTLKLTGCLSFLILIRGGVPRYRYDFLTKLGWVKFLGYVLAVFALSLLLFLVW